MVSSLDNWDGSLSRKTLKENASRATDLLLDSSAGASTLNKTTQERINALGNRHEWQDMAVDVNRAYDASRSNLNEPLSRDSLASVPATDTSLTSPSFSPTQKTFAFMPISSSPLHTRIPPVIQPPKPLTLPNPRDLPSQMNLDGLELISVHTTDGDGEDDDEDEMEVEDVLSYQASTTSQIYYESNLFHPTVPSCDGPLFTPPPEEKDICSVPSSSTKQTQDIPFSIPRQPRSRRLIMSHIQVPPLTGPRSAYQPFPTTHTSIVSKRRVAPNPHISIREVLQASIQHNADLGVLPRNNLKIRRKVTKKRREDGEATGPSSASHGPDEVVRPKKRLKNLFKDDDDDDWGAPLRSKKRPRPTSESMVIDLTITDDDEFSHPSPRSNTKVSLVTQYTKPKAKPSPKPSNPSVKPRHVKKKSTSIHAAYNSKTDIVTLCLEDIWPIPLEILALNTQFLRQSLENDVSVTGSGGYKSANINCTRQNRSRPCFLSTNANPSPIKDSEEISVGGLIWELPEEEIEKEVIEISSDSSLKENVHWNVNVPSLLPTIQVPSISAIQVKNPKEPRRPHPRRQPAADHVNRSSLTFKAPLDVSSLLAPRAIPSNMKGNPTPQYLKNKGESQRQQQQPKKRKQTSGEDINPSSATSNMLHQQVISPAHPQVAPQHRPVESQLVRQQPPGDNYSPVRSPHSPRLSLNGQAFGSGSDYLGGAMPSAKALGKRRAISSSISATPSPHRHLQLRVHPYSASIHDVHLSPHRSSTSLPHYVQNSNFNTFNTSSMSSSCDPLDTLASLFDQVSSSQNQSEIHIGGDIDKSRHTSIYNSQSQSQPQPESRGVPFFSSADSLYDDGFPGDQHDHQYDQERQNGTAIDGPWSASLVTNHPENQYTYETIDPTLLGGGPFLGEAESELESGLATDADLGVELAVRQKDSNQGEVNFGLSNRSSSSSPSSSGSTKEKSSSQFASTPDISDDEELETYGGKLPPRKRTQRVLPDMISHGDLDLLFKRPKAARKADISLSTSSASSFPDADRSDSDSELDHESDDDKPTIRKPIPIPKPLASIKKPQVRSTLPIEQKLTKKQVWPLDDVDTCCHQCRRKTFYAKMTCSDCQKKFCVRCYAFRYPDCEFDANDKEYSCPACEGFCNCTVCCRKRGEPYVGVRTRDKDSPVPRPQRRRKMNVDKLGAKTNVPPAVVQTTKIPEGVTQAWGSLYSVTGEKIGACFFNPSAEQDRSVVFAPVTTPIITSFTDVAQQVATAMAAPASEPKIHVKKTKLKQRIFIGEPQACWGYKKPKIKLLKPEPYSKRSYNSMPRYYIGKKECLFYPIEEDESSLTPIDEIDEASEIDGIEKGKSFSPDSLGDGDVTRAIFLGLSACGFAAVEMPAI